MATFFWSALPAAALEPQGPLPVRNFQPIRQIFLHFPVGAAKVLHDGEAKLSVETTQSNVIATDHGRIQALLKFEQNRTAIRGALGIGAGWEVAFDLPFLSRFGGFLDPVIDSTEDLFGAFNPERKLFPNNSFGGFRVLRDGQVLFHGPRQILELGDLAFSAQREVWKHKRGNLAGRVAIELPTGRTSAVWGSGTVDLGAGLALDYELWPEHVWLYGNLGGIAPLGRVTQARLALDPFLQQAVAFEWLWSQWTSLFLQQELYTSPFRGLHSSVLEGTIVELAAGLSRRFGPAAVWIAGVDNVSGVAQAADFSLMLGVHLRWDPGPLSAPQLAPCCRRQLPADRH